MEGEKKRDLLKQQIHQAFNHAASQPVSEPIKNSEISKDKELKELFNAISNWRLSIVKKKIKSGIDIDTKDKYGNSLLLLAGKSKNYKIIKYFIYLGANFRVSNKYGESILHYTVTSKKLLEITQYVIENMINSKYELYFLQLKNLTQRTALHLALHYHPSNIPLVKLFIKDKYKFLLNIPDINGFTPAHIAIKQNCSLEMFNFLLENGADFNILSKFNVSPLISSIINSNYEFVKLLLETFPDSIEINPISSVKQPIQYAAHNSTPNIIKHLLKCGAKVLSENSYRHPIASLCFNHKIENDEFSDLYELFINHGADINTRLSLDDSLLHNFRISSNAKLVDLLIKKGLPLNVKNSRGLNPMVNAIHCRQLEAINVLFPYYVNMKEDEDRRTLLHHACMVKPYSILNQGKVIKFLIDHKFDVNAIDKNGKTALHHLLNATPGYVYEVTVNSLTLLLENGAKVNLQDENGNTPLLIFSEIFARDTLPDHYIDCLKLLLDTPADPNIPDFYSIYPIHFISQRHLKPLELLVKHGAKIDVVTGECPIVQEYPYQTINYLLKHEMLCFTPLFAPVMNGAVEVVEFLLQRDCNLLDRKSLILSRNVLHLACENFRKNKEENNIALLKLLLRFGVSVNEQDDRGDTPLIIAVRVASESYIKRFRRGRGLCGLLASIVSSIGEPPFDPDSAVRYISVLIDGGADLRISNKACESAISIVPPEYIKLIEVLSKRSH